MSAASTSSAPAVSADDTTQLYKCAILGEMCLMLGTSPPDPSKGHGCFRCGKAVHNLCHQRLRASDTSGPNGFACGGDECVLRMTDEEKAAQLKIRDDGIEKAKGSTGAPISSTCWVPEMCSGFDLCTEKDKSAALTARCPHGWPRHFGCSQLPCFPGCGRPKPQDLQGKSSSLLPP